MTQQNQFLLSEGVSLPEETKKRLGADFDHLLSRLGECALLHGVSYGYWNADHLEIIEMARAAGSGFFPLLDEMTGELMLGVQFWQLGAKRPMFLRLFEQDGVTILRVSGKQVDVVREKTAYVRTLRRDALGDTLDVERQGYGRLPLIPLYANQEGKSELTPAIQAKIDAYDNILSDFADNLARANDVYWVLNNFSGTTEDIAEMLEEISRIKAVANLSDGSGSGATAEPHTIEVPYAARQAALNLLERALYNDYMALDMASLTGGSLTNVAIRAAMANLNLKADRYEWQVRHFMQELLTLLHLETEEIHFKRQAIANESELVADIQNMRQDIDQRTALRLNPYIADEEIGGLVKGAGTRFNAAPQAPLKRAQAAVPKTGQGAMPLVGSRGEAPLWGLGQRPNCFAGDQFKRSRQQRRRQRSVPASNFALPQERPQAALPNIYCSVAPNGRDHAA